MNRRQFLQSAFYSSIAYGAAGVSPLTGVAKAGFAPLSNKVLVNLEMAGGPDFRHFIVPEYSDNPNSYAYKYWKNRWRSHRIENSPSAWQARWENDYYPITISDAGPNQNVTFGIWRQAGWLIDMFERGNVALVCNAIGGRNRAHNHSLLILNQGDLNASNNDYGRSGWGGRLARASGGNVVSLTRTPKDFCFGPLGATPDFNVNEIDNRDLISISNSRDLGLRDFDFRNNQTHVRTDKWARAYKGYYAALQNTQVDRPYQKALDHESKLREFGSAINERLDFQVPELIRALHYPESSTSSAAYNPDPATGTPRHILRDLGFAKQIRNLYDSLASNDLLGMRVASMEYGGWDSHANQRLAVDAPDLASPFIDRGIESRFRDIFGGSSGTLNPSSPGALHGGFSALWQHLEQSDKENLVITAAGEFGRQLRCNGDFGTDHGAGNIMLVIGETVKGGVYGELFPEAEIDQYDNTQLRTPAIAGRTEIDQLFAPICDWVHQGSGNIVFPNKDMADIESGVYLGGLFDA